MGLTKTDSTLHGINRAFERTGLFKKELVRLIKRASRYGKSWENMRPGPLQDYLKRKSAYKRVKYYCNYVFVFQKTSTSLITMYPVPEEILLAQKEYDEQKGNK